MKHTRSLLFLGLFVWAICGCESAPRDNKADTDAETPLNKDTKDVDSTAASPTGK